MTATNHTEHYDLSQYVEDDHPTYTGDYNSDMSKIDAAIYAASQSGGGGMATVAHTADLTGDGSADSPLGVADTIARTEDIPSLDGYATTESVTQAIASAIADRLTAGDIKPGNGINIETSDNQVTISYVGGGSSGGLTAVAHDDTLTGDGTAGTPLGIVNGLNFSNFDTGLTWTTPLSEITTPGMYQIAGNPQDSSDGDIPESIKTYDTVVATLLVYKNATSFLKILYILFTSPHYVVRCFGKTYADFGGSAWIDLTPSNSNVSALTSRIATLESQVAALTAAATPSATGLTAEQLDSQYPDGYNIVRVGTPTPQDETEESSHE